MKVNPSSSRQPVSYQVRRLHTVSTRAWTLINIARGVYEAEGKADVYVYTVIMEHRKSLFDVAKQRDIEIVVDHSLENWPPVKVNATLLSQAILNLLDNAVKYSKDGTEIRVDGKRGVNEAILSFVSRGIQIREEEKSKIFDRYYRTLEAVAAVPAGTGIGALDCQGIYMTIVMGNYCEQCASAGTRVYVTRVQAFYSVEVMYVSPSFLEDEELLVEDLPLALAPDGFEVVATNSVTEALEYLKEEPFDVCVVGHYDACT
jgi:K+-sensing histidine kinase KdpD